MNRAIAQTLNSMKIGREGIIDKITAHSELKHRLLSLGFIKGNNIKLIAKSAAKETVVISLDRGQYALRANEAEHIVVMQNIER